MKKRELKKFNPDKFGTDLLKAAEMTDAEIDRIISKPQLFDSIAARIKAEEINRCKTNLPVKISPIFNFRIFGVAAMTIVLIIAATIFYNRANNLDEIQIAQNESITKPQIAESTNEKSNSPLPLTELKQITKNSTWTTKNAQRKPSLNRRNKTSPNPGVRKSSTVPAAPPIEKTYADEGKFYALPFADDSTDDSYMQIVRAELSRAELSALGIDLPLAENDDERFLTDLIYGTNGNPKTFRLISRL